MIRLCLSAIISLCVAHGMAQSDWKYEPLKCQGEIPIDFTQRISDKVKSDIDARIDTQHDNYREIKSKKEFLTMSNFALDDLLMSGLVLFGDPATKYVNAVAAKVMADDAELQELLRFYVIKSNRVNAFSTDQGMIFVTLGLLSQLEDEAQLAFILSHEISHYTENHTIDSFIDKKNQERQSRKYRSGDELITRLSRYSKRLEYEADSLGLQMFFKTDYSTNSAVSVFNVLQFSDLPFDEVPFDFASMENEYLTIPVEYKLDTLTAIDFDEDYSDPQGSHPAIGKRRRAMDNSVSNYGKNKGQKFLVSESQFLEVRNLSRYASVRISLRNREYVESIHKINMLMRNHPNDEFLIRSKCKAMYLLYKYTEEFGNEELIYDYDEVQGEISAAYYFFSLLEEEDLLYLTLDQFHKNMDVVEGHTQLNKMYEQLVGHFSDVLEYNLDNLQTRFDDIAQSAEDKRLQEESLLTVAVVDTTEIEGIIVKEEIDESEQSKYDKLASMRETIVEEEEEEIELDVKYSFIVVLKEVFENERFLETFENIKGERKLAQTKKEEREALFDNFNAYEIGKYEEAEEKERMLNAKRFGMNSIVFVDPQYYIVDLRKGLNHSNSEGKEYQLYNQLEKIASEAGIGATILTPKSTSTSISAESFNDQSTFKDWYSERYDHDDARQDWDIIPSEQEYVEPLADRLETDIFSISGVIRFKESSDNVGSNLLGAVVLYPLAPYFLYAAFSPDYDTYIYNVMYDVRQGQRVADDVYHMNSKGNRGSVNSFLYDSLKDIKEEKK